MKKNTQPTDDAYPAALTPEALKEMAYELQERVTHVDLKYTLTNQVAIDLLLRTVIALLNGQNGADDYVRNRLRRSGQFRLHTPGKTGRRVQSRRAVPIPSACRRSFQSAVSPYTAR